MSIWKRAQDRLDYTYYRWPLWAVIAGLLVVWLFWWTKVCQDVILLLRHGLHLISGSILREFSTSSRFFFCHSKWPATWVSADLDTHTHNTRTQYHTYLFGTEGCSEPLKGPCYCFIIFGLMMSQTVMSNCCHICVLLAIMVIDLHIISIGITVMYDF